MAVDAGAPLAPTQQQQQQQDRHSQPPQIHSALIATPIGDTTLLSLWELSIAVFVASKIVALSNTHTHRL